MGSKRCSLDITDWGQIGRGLLVAAGGAVLTYLSEYVVRTDFGVATPAVVAIFSVLVNFGRKYLKDNSNNCE